MNSSLLLFGLLLYFCHASELDLIRHTDLVNKINSIPNLGWTAKSYDQFEGLTFRQARDYCGVISPMNQLSGSSFSDELLADMRENAIRRNSESAANNISASFDSRTQWPHCPTIGTIRNQGDCGACWAFSSAEVLADRFCIHNNVNVTLSPQHLVNCDTTDTGCLGGLLDNVWWWLMGKGIATESCVPYGSTNECTFNKTSHTCVTKGEQPQLYFASSGYRVGPEVADFQNELMNNGPVQGICTLFAADIPVSFFVYDDFMTYRGGVYQLTNGSRFVGFHATKLVGWGVDTNGVEYWTLANSWGPSWGENGFFRIRRGVDEVGIEAAAAAGMPGSIKSPEEIHEVQEFQEEATQNKKIPIVGQTEDSKETLAEESDSLPTFPDEFSANGTYGSGLAGFPACWYWSSTKQSQRLDYLMLNHTYSQFFNYSDQTAYWYYMMFDSIVCYYYPTVTGKLGPGVPSTATPVGNTACQLGYQATNCSMWEQSYDDYSVYVSLTTTNSLPSYPVAFEQSEGIGNDIVWKWSSFQNTVDETKLKTPDSDCLPWPGSPIWPPVN